ncbi:MAG: hypothetical protein HC819_08610 [Cyclobacteriaceae bacterium]|nr:hypothetical protein [Cyclobacteriaceae bacterium]
MEVLSKMKKGWLLVAIVVSVITLQGCLTNDNEDVYDGYKYLQEDVATLQEYFEANNIDVTLDSTSGVFYRIDGQGDGYKTVNNVEVEINYQGTSLDGIEFANNLGSGPIAFTIGNTETYPASLTEGVIIGLFKMHEGDTATIYSPSPYGFKDETFQTLPPHSILVYKVVFRKIKKLDEEFAKIDQYIAANNMTASIDSVFGTRYVRHRKGNNVKIKEKAYVSLKYQGELLDGTVFDSSYEADGNPLNFTFLDSNPNNRYLIGFEMGLFHLYENDSATIFVPSIYGYRDKAKNEIPANSTLVFGVDITRVSNIN